MTALRYNARHYNRVTDEWKEIMGDNFHFGYFNEDNIELSAATDRLIDTLASHCTITDDTKILDVGCGIGNPAFYLHRKYGSTITGISTSKRGIEIARQSSKDLGYERSVTFKVADAMNSGFSDTSFDLAWVMESSHLMKDKQQLVNECFRVLRPGGKMVLCDIVLIDNPALLSYMASWLKIYRIIRAFGNARLNSLGTYCNMFVKAGFRDIRVVNISGETVKTLKWWQHVAQKKYDQNVQGPAKKGLLVFINGCRELLDYFQQGAFGYGIILGVK